MELRQLEYFVAVAEEASFTRAADRVHISQSGVSAQIRQLERELGAPLLDRSSRTATVTEAGAAALEHAYAALDAAAALRRSVDEVNGLMRGRVRVGMVTGCTISPLFDALAAFRRRHPGIELELSEDNSEELLERVRAGGLDLALVGTAGRLPDGTESLPIISEPLVLAVADDHPLAGLGEVTLAALGSHPLICMPTGTGIRTVFDGACTAAGVSLDIALQASAPAAIADLAARGLGAAVLSASMASAQADRLEAQGEALTVVALPEVDGPAMLALVWKLSVNAARQELLAHCRAAFAPAPA